MSTLIFFLMAAIRDPVCQEGEDEPISIAQQHPHQLLKKQLHSRDRTLKSVLVQGRNFAPGVEFNSSSELEGLQSLEQYQDRKKEHLKVAHLRELGLTSKEIELKLTDSGEESLLPCSAKRRKVAVEPAAQKERVKALNQKICSREEILQQPLAFAGAHHMSRYTMEVEKSLYLDWEKPLTHLTEDSQCHVPYPKSHHTIPRVWPSMEPHPSSGKMEGCGSSVCVLPLPPQVVERNRLTEAEIRAMPRFRNYCQGEPSKVLYLKNMHQSVRTEDLQAVFGSLQKATGCSGDSGGSKEQEELHIRLMKGKMRGQAFVEFTRVSDAVRGLEAVNGFVMRGKPVIICYGRKK